MNEPAHPPSRPSDLSGSSTHVVDYRVSVPVPFAGRYYLVVLSGRERRNPDRLAGEGQTSTSRIAALYSTLAAAMLGFAVFGMFSCLYLVKSLVGIDIFPGDLPLHPLYRLLITG